MVRNRWVAAALTAVVVISAGATVRGQRGQPAPEGKSSAAPAPLNLNVATAADLEKLPGIGPALAARIVDYRQKNGGFKKIEELMNVQGIGEQSFLKLKPLLVIAPARTAER
jgi:competence protein ComEA